MSDAFQSAQERVKQLPTRPNQQELLTLYALFKQATDGDASGKRPGMLQMVARAKFDAWSERKGMAQDAAAAAYVATVEALEEKYG